MKPIRVPETVRLLGAPPGMEDEVQGLPVHIQEKFDRQCVTSVWMLSEEDLILIRAGGNIRLGVMGPHPPVYLWVE